MARIKKLRFFVKKPQYAKTYFTVKGGYEPKDRDLLSFIYEHKPIILNGVKFWPEHVYAEPRKKSAWFEVLIFAVLPGLVLDLFGNNIPTEKYVISAGLGVVFGVLVGLFRIDRQRVAANKFNGSKYGR